jgi:ribosomal protein S6
VSNRDYELTTISKEESLPAVEQAITRAGGTIVVQRSLGRRSFAYPIDKETAGFYSAYQLTLDPTTSAQLDKELRLMKPDLLRHLLVSLPVAKMNASLDEAETLKEAKEVTADDGTIPAKPSDDDKVRGKKLDEQLGKLLSDDGGTTADGSSTNN